MNGFISLLTLIIVFITRQEVSLNFLFSQNGKD